jgi:hypothetical protein
VSCDDPVQLTADPVCTSGFNPYPAPFNFAFFPGGGLEMPTPAPEAPPIELPPIAAPAVGVGTSILTGLGIAAGAVLGALIPGSTPIAQPLEPQPATLPPVGPPTGSVTTTEAPFLPPNWWELAQGGIFGLPSPVEPPPKISSGLASLSDILSRLLQPGNLGDINVPTPTPTPVGSPGVGQPVETGAPLETITVSAPRPGGAPAVVVAPVLSPIGIPQFPPATLAGIAARSVEPHEPIFRPRVQPRPSVVPVVFPGIPDVPIVQPRPTAPRVAPIVSPVQPIVGPIVRPGVGPIVAFPPSPTPLPSPIGSKPPAPPTPVVGVTGPGLVPFDDPMTEPQAQAQAAYRQCVTTKQKDRKRKPRNKCWRGTYEELRHGLIKHRKEQIPCR